MGGIARRSGPVGNLNASRYPWRAFWRRRAVRAEHRWLPPLVEAYVGGLESDKGGASEVSEGERRMMQVAATAHGCALLVLDHAARLGFVRVEEGGRWDLQPGMKELGKFLSIEQAALKGLDLRRRPKAAPSLADYIAANYTEAEGPSVGEPLDAPEIEADGIPAPEDDLAPAALAAAEVSRVDEPAPVPPSAPAAYARTQEAAPAGLSHVESPAPEPPSGPQAEALTLANRIASARTVRLWSNRP